MGMEVGVATQTVAGQGGRKRRGGGSQDQQRNGERRRTAKKGPHCLCVCARVFFVQSLCNNVQRTAAEMRPRSSSVALRARSVYARTSSSDFTTWG